MEYTSRAESITQFLTVFLVFLLVLALTYFTTRFVGAFQKSSIVNRNFEVIETYKVTNGKFLQIVRVGKKYIVISIAKDNIDKICELSEDEIVFEPEKSSTTDTFKIILDKAREHIGKGGNQNDK